MFSTRSELTSDEGIMELDGVKMHCFDGHAVLAKVAIKDGKASFKSRYLRTEVRDGFLTIESRWWKNFSWVGFWLIHYSRTIVTWSSGLHQNFLKFFLEIGLSVIVNDIKFHLIASFWRQLPGVMLPILYPWILFLQWVVTQCTMFSHVIKCCLVQAYDKEVVKAKKVIYRGFGSQKPGGMLANFMDFA